MAVWGLVTGGFAPFANVYFVHHLGLSLQAMGSIFSLSQLIQVVAILLAPLLFRRLGLATGVMFSQLATAAMLLLLAFAHTFVHAAWLYCAYMAAQYMNEPGIYSLLMDNIEPSERNGASSYTSFIGSGSRILASTAVGYSIIHFGYPVVLGAMAALAVVAALLFRRLPRVASLPVTKTAAVR
jgi:MFS family permease